ITSGARSGGCGPCGWTSNTSGRPSWAHGWNAISAASSGTAVSSPSIATCGSATSSRPGQTPRSRWKTGRPAPDAGSAAGRAEDGAAGGVLQLQGIAAALGRPAIAQVVVQAAAGLPGQHDGVAARRRHHERFAFRADDGEEIVGAAEDRV